MDLLHFAVVIIVPLRISHASDRRSRTGVSRDPIWRKKFIPGDCNRRLLMPAGVEQAGNYLASFGRSFGQSFGCLFIVERRGGFHLYQLRYQLHRNRRWLSGSLPFK
jgi:hypothetical protein